MTFPIESEATIRRRMLDICQDHARSIVEVTRSLSLLVDSMLDNKAKAAKDEYESIRKTLEQTDKLKNTLLGEVASVGSLLINREDFLNLIFTVGSIGDYVEGVAFRLSGTLDKSWKIDKKFLTKVAELMSLVLEEITMMRDTMLALNFNPARAIELSRGVESIERKIDNNYRVLNLEALESKMPIQSVLILRDIIEHIENIADKGVEVVDIIRIIALSA